MKMRKFLVMLTAATMAMGTLAGCGGSDAGSDSTAQAEETQEAAEGTEETAAETTAEGPITVVSREDGSGTRGAFIELFGVQEEQNG